MHTAKSSAQEQTTTLANAGAGAPNTLAPIYSEPHYVSVALGHDSAISSTMRTYKPTPPGLATPFPSTDSPSEVLAARLRRSLSVEELRDRPALILIAHSDPSIIATLRRQFDLLGFRVEVEEVSSSPSPIAKDFAKVSVQKVKDLAKARELPIDQIKVIEYELNCGKTTQTPIIAEMIKEFTSAFEKVYVITFSGVDTHIELVEKTKAELLKEGMPASQLEHFIFKPKSQLSARDLMATGKAALAEAGITAEATTKVRISATSTPHTPSELATSTSNLTVLSPRTALLLGKVKPASPITSAKPADKA